MNSYTIFWHWFFDHETEFYESIEQEAEHFVPLIDEKLKAINPHLVFEISEVLDDYREIIISADGMKEAFDDVYQLASCFPGHPRWKMLALRQRENTKDHHVEIDGLVLGYEDIFFRLERLDEGQHIFVYIDGYDGYDQRYVHAYFLLLDALIGEYDAVTCIQKTSLIQKPGEKTLLPMYQLLKIIDNQKESID